MGTGEASRMWALTFASLGPAVSEWDVLLFLMSQSPHILESTFLTQLYCSLICVFVFFVYQSLLLKE